MLAPLVVTAGEPAGIGPDLCIGLVSSLPSIPLVVVADKNLLAQRASQLGLNIKLYDYVENQPIPRDGLTVLHIPLQAECVAGQLNVENSSYVLATLSRALDGCVSGEFAALVTAPVHKGIINDAGIEFTGHTEFFAERTNTPQVVMMLVSGESKMPDLPPCTPMRVALATTHLPLKEVAAALTPSLLEDVLRIVHGDLQQRFGIDAPRILVAGLNPHAGEGGYLGREEIDIMIPVLDQLRAEGLDVSVPLPADTLFTQHKLAQSDAVLAMYHDQGLPVLKHASFGQGVNVTLGMPIIRTSVDHGTALELAGRGTAHGGSLREAIAVAEKMVLCQQKTIQ